MSSAPPLARVGGAALLGLAAALGSTASHAQTPPAAGDAAGAPYGWVPKFRPYQGEASVPGYQLITRYNRSLGIAGVATFSGFWGVSISTSLFLAIGKSYKRVCFGAACPKVDPGIEHWALLIPVFGPFIGMKTTHPTPASVVGLGVLGAGQLAGAGMLIGSLVWPQKVWKRDDLGLTVLPWLSPQATGLSIGGAL